MKVAKSNGISHDAYSVDHTIPALALVQRQAGVVLPSSMMGGQFQPQCRVAGLKSGQDIYVLSVLRGTHENGGLAKIGKSLPSFPVDCSRLNPALYKYQGEGAMQDLLPHEIGFPEQTMKFAGNSIV